MGSGLIRRTQFTSLRDYTVIDRITIQETGGYKDQWPPVGKSSDTPKEVKTQDGKDDHRSLGKPADMGRDMFICIHAYPVIWLTSRIWFVRIVIMKKKNCLSGISARPSYASVVTTKPCNYIFIQG